jgi:hypothetical protein
VGRRRRDYLLEAVDTAFAVPVAARLDQRLERMRGRRLDPEDVPDAGQILHDAVFEATGPGLPHRRERLGRPLNLRVRVSRHYGVRSEVLYFDVRNEVARSLPLPSVRPQQEPLRLGLYAPRGGRRRG